MKKCVFLTITNEIMSDKERFKLSSALAVFQIRVEGCRRLLTFFMNRPLCKLHWYCATYSQNIKQDKCLFFANAQINDKYNIRQIII